MRASVALGLQATRCHSVQRLLWAGSVLDRRSASLREVPGDWLLSLGVQADVEQGLSFTKLVASHSHCLLAYKTLPPALPVTMEAEGHPEEDEEQYINPSGLHKVAAIGRNTFGELGLGFASQESTWGMVSSGFTGQAGITHLSAGLGSSWIVTADNANKSLVHAFGNHTSGQLGLGGPSRPYALSEGGEPQLLLYSSPRNVKFGKESEDAEVMTLASGLDHTIVLMRKGKEQQIRACGINTDGQLGLPDHRVSLPSMLEIPPPSFLPQGLPDVSEDPLVGIAAGGDTSIAWTKSGRVWGWGNSEYGQALVNGEAIDRIDVPTEATEALAQALVPGARVVDVKLGGSFVVILDDRGNVYTAGFGALGQGKERLESVRPVHILSDAISISTGLEQASAVIRTGDGQTSLFVWGLDSAAGRLSLGQRKPWPSYMIASRFTPDEPECRVYEPVRVAALRQEWIKQQGSILDVVHGRDAMFVLVEDGVEEVGRWASK